MAESDNIFCKILEGFLNFIEEGTYAGKKDREKILATDYFDYGLGTLFLIPGINKILGLEIIKIDNMRKGIREVIQADKDPKEIWDNYVDFFIKEYDKNCRPIEPLLSNVISTKELLDIMRKMRIESNDINQIITDRGAYYNQQRRIKRSIHR